MRKNPVKDFGPIADDYAFFERHATEAEEDARSYLERLRDIAPADGPIRMLDFGCGSGSFTARLLREAKWPAERLRLTLVEPAELARRQAVGQLAGYTSTPIADSSAVPAGSTASFDIVLANHSLYYVPDLRRELARLIDALFHPGIFLCAIAGRANALIQLWITAFGLLGSEIPYHTSEDVEKALQELGAEHDKHQVSFELTFPDSEENRMRIIRFLLADHLSQMPLDSLLASFDRYSRSGRIRVPTTSDHFTIHVA